MLRKIIHIDAEKCNGCGLCATACHEGAIGMVNGKAVLLREDYCDGLGDCLPACPVSAITFVEREALPFDEEGAKKKMAAAHAGGCPGSAAMRIERNTSELAQWPVQIKLVPINAPYFDGADLLIAADCAAYAHGNFHRDFMRGRVTLIGCPKLDEGDYAEKLTAILANNSIRSVTVARMQVPCCGGIERAAAIAVQGCGKEIPFEVVTLSTGGEIVK